MDHRLQPASREQIVAIIRQRAERHRDFAVVPNGLFDFRALAPPQLPFANPGLNIGAGGPLRPPFYRQASVDEEIGQAPKVHNVTMEGEALTYSGKEGEKQGLYIAGKALNTVNNYFEVTIVDKSSHVPTIAIGLAGRRHPLEAKLGVGYESIAFHAGEGLIYKGRSRGHRFGPVCDVGDKIGCGIRPVANAEPKYDVEALGPLLGNFGDLMVSKACVFFTRNGIEIGSQVTSVPFGGLFPAVSLQNSGDEVVLQVNKVWPHDDESVMLVDSGEDEWQRLHDVRVNGNVLEYVGRGKSSIDVGLAQARTPIGTRNHYFEMEIIDPGVSCFIAIGLARKDYPKNRHPGWNKGSIAYHADDGKVFVGNGVGSPFGPRCHKGDVMGCGVLFPRNYECKSDSEEELEQQGGIDQYGGDDLEPDYGQLECISDSGEEDEWWNDRNYIQSGVQVQIYFTRNGKVIGKKEVRIPKGGFYPTIGMMSCEEKVRVDLRPLSG